MALHSRCLLWRMHRTGKGNQVLLLVLVLVQVLLLVSQRRSCRCCICMLCKVTCMLLKSPGGGQRRRAVTAIKDRVCTSSTSEAIT